MSDTKDIAKILSCPSTMADAWLALFRNINCKDMMLKIYPEEQNNVRMVGPFVSAQRMFVPIIESINCCTNTDIANILSEKNPDLLSTKIRAVKTKIVAAVRANPKQYLPNERIKEFNGFAGSNYTDEHILNLIPSLAFEGLQNVRRGPRGGRNSRNNRNYDNMHPRDAFGPPLTEPAPQWNLGSLSQPGELSTAEDISFRLNRLNQLKSAIDFLKVMEGSKKWQDCVMVNVVKLGQNKIRVLCLFRSLIDLLMVECRRVNPEHPGMVKINGLQAHNISISREGMGPTNSNFRVSLSRECDYLPPQIVEMLFSEGLIDIPDFVDKLNERVGCGSYYYRVRTPYKMAEEFYGTL